MRIGLDAHSLFDKKKSGIAKYIIKIVEFLDSKGFECFLFSRKEQNLKIKGKHIKTIITKGYSQYSRHYWDDFVLPGLIRKYKIDLYHAPSNFGIPACRKNPCKMVLTIHDIAPAVLTDYYKDASKEIMKEYQSYPGLSARFADKVIAVSNNTKKDICDFFGIKENKIEVIYQGDDKSIKQNLDERVFEKYQKKYDFGDNYIIYVSEVALRKNHGRLIRAFSDFKRTDKRGFKLLLAGKAHEEFVGPLKEIIKETGQEKNIIFLDYMSERDLSILLSFAEFMVYPSLYEGFGLPLLEAMACGCPVVCSDISSLPEVAGKAAYFFDPYSEKAITAAMKKVSGDDGLKAEMVRKGFTQIGKFSWEKTQKETFEVYKKLLKLK